jgi:transcriptional regulator with XRE-family HTH domain
MIDRNEPQWTRHGQERKTLRDWRDARGMTMQQLAQAARLSLSALDNLEHGRTQPSVEVAGRLAEVLDVYMEQIIWLKPGGRIRPPTRLFRLFGATEQIEMAAAVFQVVNYHEPLESALEQLRKRLEKSGTSGDQIDAAIARVRGVVVEDSYRQRAKILETRIRNELKQSPALHDLSVQGIVEPKGDDPRWGVRLLSAHVHNFPTPDVYSDEDWEKLKSTVMPASW